MQIISPVGTLRLGVFASFATAGGLAVYVIVLGLGLSSLPSPDHPIGDPYFTMLEVLILLVMPLMVLMTTVIHLSAPPDLKALGLASVIFMAMTACVTSIVHFSILVLRPRPPFTEMRWLLAFEWPSVAYALDILAWDVFFALSMLFAAPMFRGRGLAGWIRRLLRTSGLLALLGLAGVVAGDMQIRNIGVLGYAVVFPVAALLIGLHFRQGIARGAVSSR